MEEDLLKLIFFHFLKINYQIEGHQLGEGWTILLIYNIYLYILYRFILYSLQILNF